MANGWIHNCALAGILGVLLQGSAWAQANPDVSLRNALQATPTPAPAENTFLGPSIKPRTTDESEEQVAKMFDPGKVTIETPMQDEVLADSEVTVFIRTQNGTSDPREDRFHVIVDNEDPIVHEDERRPIVLKGLGEGGHVVRVFSLQPDGTARPLPDSYAVVRFFVKKKDFKNFVDFHAPYITVNQPTNGVVAKDEQQRVCFDFLVHNANLGRSGYKIRYFLDRKEHLVDQAKPIYWSNLTEGRHTLLVELLDSTGDPVMGLFNRVERNFEIPQILKPMMNDPAESDHEPGDIDFVPEE